MRSRIHPVQAFANLPLLKEEVERRKSWRQALTILGQQVRVQGPSPLEVIEPQALIAATRVAIETGLVNDLDWTEPSKAAVALYELTLALPTGAERRELGRRVLQRAYEGTASTFAAVATRMALASARSLDTAPLRARVSLLYELPIGSSVNADALALQLVVRRDSFQRWLAGPSMGALPARCLAAKLFEHAAREATIRIQQGDSFGTRTLLSAELQPVLRRLLVDREPLVWRHAAIAKGLLATVDRTGREELEAALDPSLSIAEWRRAAVSLVALVSGDPETGLKQCRRLLSSEVGQQDPGMAAVMVAGLPPVIESEPEAAEELLALLLASGRWDVAEAAAQLLGHLRHRTFGVRSSRALRDVLKDPAAAGAPGSQHLVQCAVRLLDRDAADGSLGEALRQSLLAYEMTGARAAHEAALALLRSSVSAVESLVGLSSQDTDTVCSALAVLSDFDASCLRRSCIADLLLLGRRPGELDASVPEVERLYHRVGGLLLERKTEPDRAQAFPLAPLVQRRRLEALLHLVDAESLHGETDAEAPRIRARLRRIAEVLLTEVVQNRDRVNRRILCATLARSLDALVREGVSDSSDLFLLVAAQLTDRESVGAVAEGSTNPDVGGPLQALYRFLGPASEDSPDEPPSSPAPDRLTSEEADVAHRLVRLSQALGPGGSYRSEMLRQVVLRMGRSLEVIAGARGLSELTDRRRSSIDALRELDEGCVLLRSLLLGATHRVLGTAVSPTVDSEGIPLSLLVERATSSNMPLGRDPVETAARHLVMGIPEPLACAVTTVCARLAGLPIAAASDVYAIPLARRQAPLPDWLLPRRTAGAFYVERALGSGGTSSVFVARRTEERHNPRAPLFALKVPEYDPTTARSLTEREFFELFRGEAGALLSLPRHPNLAGFVTFDLAARPKPILVMELINGVGLDRLIRSRSLTMKRALEFLDGILCGLVAMHEAGIGHLDLKPSNVILRDNRVPVLVDFGLSGRKIRPGCGTLDYCAPEILAVEAEPWAVAPMTADIYAFGSLAFEMLTAQPLFDAKDELDLVTQHVSHDGWPSKLARMGRDPPTADISMVLASCLRHDARNRPDAGAVRAALGSVASRYEEMPWPLCSDRTSLCPQTAS